MTAKERFNDIYHALLASKKVSNKTDFAAKLGYNRSYISELFNEKKEITELFARSLESSFHISPDWLLNGNGQMFVTGYNADNSYNIVSEDIVPYKTKVDNTPLPLLLAEILKDIDDIKKKINAKKY